MKTTGVPRPVSSTWSPVPSRVATLGMRLASPRRSFAYKRKASPSRAGRASGLVIPGRREAAGPESRAVGIACHYGFRVRAFGAPRNDRREIFNSPLHTHNRLGGVAHRLDVLAAVEERDDAARAAFEALVAPRECADQAALVEHQLDVAAEVLGVQQALLERPAVERK